MATACAYVYLFLLVCTSDWRAKKFSVRLTLAQPLRSHYVCAFYAMMHENLIRQCSTAILAAVIRKVGASGISKQILFKHLRAPNMLRNPVHDKNSYEENLAVGS